MSRARAVGGICTTRYAGPASHSEWPAPCDTYNVNPSESRGRFEESLQLIRKAWTEPQPFGWQGRYCEYRSICIWPRPVQQPHPPIYMSTASPEAGEFAAKHRLGAGFAFTTLQIATEAARYYREQCRLQAWDPGPEDIVYRLGMHIAETDEEAMEDLARAGGGQPATARSCGGKTVGPCAGGYRGMIFGGPVLQEPSGGAAGE